MWNEFDINNEINVLIQFWMNSIQQKLSNLDYFSFLNKFGEKSWNYRQL